MSDTKLQLISQVFRDGATIPIQYTCKGQNVNPPLNIMAVPSGTKSLALVLHDPDAPPGDYTHWVLWDIPTSTETISVNSLPVGVVQGVNSAGENAYMGPCPPRGTGIHRYKFELYALDKTLSLPKNSGREQLEKAMKNHVIGHNTLTGVFGVD